MKLLLVEDERKLSEALQKGLKKLGFAVDAAYDGEEALYFIEENHYDAIILDINLPKINGFGVLKKLRERTNSTKVLILSAKNQVEDKVKGLDLGANDYLEKPFDFLELSARIRNLLRWDFVVKHNITTYKNLIINSSNKTVKKDNEDIYLTNKEYAVLEYLIDNCERYVKAEEIISHVWDSDAEMYANSFKFHIYTLKKKLGVTGAIVNLRSQGYKFGGEEHEDFEE